MQVTWKPPLQRLHWNLPDSADAGHKREKHSAKPDTFCVYDVTCGQKEALFPCGKRKLVFCKRGLSCSNIVYPKM